MFWKYINKVSKYTYWFGAAEFVANVAGYDRLGKGTRTQSSWLKSSTEWKSIWVQSVTLLFTAPATFPVKNLPILLQLKLEFVNSFRFMF